MTRAYLKNSFLLHRTMFSHALHHINSARNIFLTSHKNCPDATGSVCALIDFFHARGKRVYPFLAEPVLKNLRYLPWSDGIRTDIPELSLFDLFLIVDAGDLKQTGIAEQLIRVRRSAIINIDHHKTNEHFGEINIVDKNASSTCELLYTLISTNNHAITPTAAECLLTGIVGDTDNFTNAATTKRSLQIASDLVFQGANIFHIIQRLVGTEASINTLRLWGTIFERLTYNKKYGIAVSYVMQEDLRRCSVSEDAVELVSNLLNHICGIKAGVLMKETKNGAYKVSMRSTDDTIDLAFLARSAGGGGHKKAAGFTVSAVSCKL